MMQCNLLRHELPRGCLAYANSDSCLKLWRQVRRWATQYRAPALPPYPLTDLSMH